MPKKNLDESTAWDTKRSGKEGWIDGRMRQKLMPKELGEIKANEHEKNIEKLPALEIDS